MDKIQTVNFTFRSKTYSALVRTKTREHKKWHYVTIMNGKLEQLFFGHHIIIDNNGVLSWPEETLDDQLLELKQSVTKALSQLPQEEYEKLS